MTKLNIQKKIKTFPSSSIPVIQTSSFTSFELNVNMTIKKLKNCDISGFKLVLPTVSTANVAQLSADLFIESLRMEKFAMVI